MDVRERKQAGERHPWELARAVTLRRLLGRAIIRDPSLTVLDVGCGDAFVTQNLFPNATDKRIWGIDVNLTQKECDEISSRNSFLAVGKSYDVLGKRRFSLILFLDVLEHVADDGTFLSDIVSRYLKKGGRVLITVPAHPRLFGEHDRFLEHVRRYSARDLGKCLARSGLRCSEWGFLFFSPMIVRFFENIFAHIFPSLKKSRGIGAWDGGEIVTNILVMILVFENAAMIFFNKLSLRIPGLTLWALCSK